MAKQDVTKLAVADLSADQAKAEHARLHAELTAHDKRYFQDDAPTVSDAEYDALRQRYGAIEQRVPELRTLESLTLKVGVGADRALRQGAACRADALARQCVRGRGRNALRRAHPSFPQARCRGAAGLLRRAENRWAVAVAALSGRQARQCGDARRRRRGRGRHRERPHAEGCATDAQGQGDSGDRGGARRGLHDQGRLPRTQRAPEGRGGGALCQSAQHRGRLAAAEGSGHYGVAAVALLRLCVGPDERDAGRHALRHGEVARALRLAHQPDLQAVQVRRGAHRVPSRDRAEARRARLRYRRRRLQGRPARLAGAAGLRVSQPPLGSRAQIPGRAGDHAVARHRDPGRTHRRAHAGRQARAGHGRRRGGAERDPAQCRRDRTARRAHRRHRDDPARRRRDSAGARCRAGEAAEGREGVRVSQDVPVPIEDAGGARDQFGR